MTAQHDPGSTAAREASPGDGKIAFAQSLRGWAALTVAVGHLCVGFWANPAGVSFLTGLAGPATVPPSPLIATAVNWVAANLFIKTGFQLLFAPFGVGLFFLISGFVIPFAFRRQNRLGFLAGRLARLWPTYAVGLSIAVLSIWGGSLISGRPFFLSRNAILPQYVLGLRDLMWLPTIDGVVWTLEIEVRFYILCALLAPWLAAGRVRLFYVVAPSLALLVYVCGHNGPRFAERHPDWFPFCHAIATSGRAIGFMLVGTVFHFLHRGWIDRLHAAALVPFLLALSMIAGHRGEVAGTDYPSLWNELLAVAIFAACYAFRDRIRGGGAIGWLADISYPLYAVHGIFGYVVMTLLLQVGGLSSDVICAVGFGSAVLLAWAVHVWVEKPTHRFASHIARQLSAAPDRATVELKILAAETGADNSERRRRSA